MNAIFVLGCLAAIFAFCLAVASKIFSIAEDPKKAKILELLPGINCGACGFGGCEAFAKALSDGNVMVDKCSATKPEFRKRIGGIIGQEIAELERKVAVIFCSGGKKCINKFDYQGVKTCQAASLIFRGHKACVYGCLGFGDCARECPFDAISYIEDEIPIIDRNKCTGCGVCVRICPKKIISLVIEKYNVHVQCNSMDSGDYTRKVCSRGCISCGVCIKICPVKAIEIENNLAKINYSKCTGCGLCIDRCPSNTIGRVLSPIEV